MFRLRFIGTQNSTLMSFLMYAQLVLSYLIIGLTLVSTSRSVTLCMAPNELRDTGVELQYNNHSQLSMAVLKSSVLIHGYHKDAHTPNKNVGEF